MIVMTGGCFDLFHVGHLECLQEAKGYGDILLVELGDDDSVRKLKGEGRPILSACDRARIVDNVVCVDYTVICTEANYPKLVKSIMPDIYFMGPDYTQIPFPIPAQRYAGKCIASKLYKRPLDTTGIISRIQSNFGN